MDSALLAIHICRQCVSHNMRTVREKVWASFYFFRRRLWDGVLVYWIALIVMRRPRLAFIVCTTTSIAWSATATDKMRVKASGCFLEGHATVHFLGTKPPLMSTAMLTVDHEGESYVSTLLVRRHRWSCPIFPRIASLLGSGVGTLSTKIPCPSRVSSRSISPIWWCSPFGFVIGKPRC